MDQIMVELHLDELVASVTNPRKRFDAERAEELERSVAVQGVLAPLLVRPLSSFGGGYEIVAGERRWRAARRVGLKSVPCIVRSMSDAEVLEAQLIENMQRDDLEPLEEARGFAAMLGVRDEVGVAVYDVAAIARRIGKGVDFVYRRLKLLDLSEDGLEALAAGRIETGVAEMLARIPDARLRARALADVLRPSGYDRALNVRETRRMIGERYMRSLAAARFDPEDGGLHPLGQVCSTCPRRAGNDPDAEGVRADMCLDPGCFAKKTEAAFRRWRAAHAAEGKRVLDPEENEKHVAGDRLVAWMSRYVPLDEVPAEHLLNASSRGRVEMTWRQLVEGRGVEVIVARRDDDGVIECADREVATAAARMNGYEIFRLTCNEERAAYESECRRLAAEVKWRRVRNARIVERVQTRCGADVELWLRELCVWVAENCELPPILEARQAKSLKGFAGEIGRSRGAELSCAAAQIVIALIGIDTAGNITQRGAKLLKQIGVDVKGIERSLRARDGKK